MDEEALRVDDGSSIWVLLLSGILLMGCNIYCRAMLAPRLEGVESSVSLEDDVQSLAEVEGCVVVKELGFLLADERSFRLDEVIWKPWEEKGLGRNI